MAIGYPSRCTFGDLHELFKGEASRKQTFGRRLPVNSDCAPWRNLHIYANCTDDCRHVKCAPGLWRQRRTVHNSHRRIRRSNANATCATSYGLPIVVQCLLSFK
eukprot:4112724-Pleurochrysis_carterae.AAC.2